MTISPVRARASLRRRLVVFGSVGVLLTATGVVLLVGLSGRLRNDLSAATEAFVEEQVIADRISQAVMRGFLLVSAARTPEYESASRDFRAAAEVTYRQLRRYLMRDLTPPERLQVEVIREEHQRLEVAAVRAMDLFRRGEAAAGAASFDEMGVHGLALLDALEAFLGMRAANLAHLRHRQDGVMRATYGAGAAFGMMMFIGSVALARFLRRRVTAPLSQLAAAAGRWERGELAARVPEARDEEFAALAESFNRMAESLEEALDAARRSEESFRHLFASNPLSMWVYDLETLRFLEVNDAAVSHYGYAREEFLGMRLTDIRPPDDVRRLLADIARARPPMLHSGEWRHRLKDGRLIDVDITSHLLDFADRRAALVVATDISARKRAEAEIRALNAELEQRVARRTAALRESEEQFRTLAVTAHDAIVAADDQGCITYFNPGAERIFGYAAADVRGAPLTVLMPERFHDAHRRGVARYLATGEARVLGRTVELVGRRKDGTEFPLELSLASKRSDDTPSFIGIIRDITERKEAEQAIQRYAADLETANKDLEAFSYSVSHDLRAPLRSIHGFSQAVLEDYRDRLDAQGVRYLRRVCAAAERMGVLIDDLLELSHATLADIRRGRVDLSRLADRAATELRTAEPDRRVRFRIRKPLLVLGDQRLLTLVMRNLVGNAWKFTANRDPAVIEVGVIDADRAYFVRDNGAGFDMTYADKLFQPFQRLHAARDFAGTGIGLALVQRIVHRHGGRVWAEGAVDQGATFFFTLPDA